jgi:hypothetical protein
MGLLGDISPDPLRKWIAIVLDDLTLDLPNLPAPRASNSIPANPHQSRRAVTISLY